LAERSITNTTGTMRDNRPTAAVVMRLLQLSDSALPIGTFSFSNTLESAVEWGVVGDRESLKEYCTEVLRVAALSDGVAALHALKACDKGRYDDILRADKLLFCSKASGEARLMTQRMGRKLAELGVALSSDATLLRWHDDIRRGEVAGCCAVSQGIIASVFGIGEEELFASLCYSAVMMILSAALRSMRVTHIATQQIIGELCGLTEPLLAEARALTIEDMQSFAPQYDIMASLHEKGDKRLFMN
jgi:urease accessory protein